MKDDLVDILRNAFQTNFRNLIVRMAEKVPPKPHFILGVKGDYEHQFSNLANEPRTAASFQLPLISSSLASFYSLFPLLPLLVLLILV